jgi:NitT/TauT family transport system substrate-binding protein
MKKVIISIVFVAIFVGVVFWQKAEPTELPTVRLSLLTQPTMALVKVGLDKNFFEQEGIKVEISEFTAGKFALQALIGGSLDLITAAEFPVTLAVANGERLAILTEVNETIGGFPMTLRKDGDTFDAQKYFTKKRKIATSIGGGPEFFTADFFKKYNIQPSQYEIVSMKPEDMPIALAQGSVDGIAIYEPFTHFAVERTGEDKIFSVKSDDLYTETMILVGKKEWVLQHTDTVEKFLRALKKSEAFVKKNPEEAMNIVSSFTKLDKTALQSIWPTFSLSIGLDKKLVLTMEEEVEWAKDTGKLPREIVTPNFREVIFEAPLKKVAPSTVEL